MCRWCLCCVCIETAVNIGYSCRLLTDDIDETFTVDGESHELVLSQLSNAMTMMQNKPSPASVTDSGMIVADDGAGQYVIKTFSNGSLAKFPLSVSIRDGQQDTSVGFGDGPNVSAESGQYALVISGHSLVRTSPISCLFVNYLFVFVKQFSKITRHSIGGNVTEKISNQMLIKFPPYLATAFALRDTLCKHENCIFSHQCCITVFKN